GAVSYGSMNLAESGQPERVTVAYATHDFFDVFGIRPALGRTFVASEDEPGQDQVVVLGHSLWRDRYASDPRVIGATIRLSTRPYRVIGVMPEGFDPLLSREQMWVPSAFTPAQRAQHDEHYLNVVGVLKDHVTRATANADVVAAMKDLEQRFPKDNAERS